MHFPRPRRPRHAAAQLAVLPFVAAGSGLAAAAAPASAATCANIDVVVARGTFETGTLGTIVGDPVYAALQSALAGKSTSSYPVNYPASLDVFSNPNSATRGNTDLVNHVTSQAAACPSQRFILVGYSQGADVFDNSIAFSIDVALFGGPSAEPIPSSI